MIFSRAGDRRIGFLLLLLAAAGWIADKGLSRMADRMVRQRIPPGSAVGSVRWEWPVGLSIYDLTLPDPAEQASFLLKVKRARFQVPIWGLLIRPMPARMTLWSAHVQMHSGNIDPVVRGMGLKPQRWLPVPLWDNSGEGQAFSLAALPRIPFAPMGIEIIDGRLDAGEQEIRKDHPVFIADQIHLVVGLQGLLQEPVLTLEGSGRFVSEEGESVGLQSMQGTLYPRKKQMKGTLRLRHERLGDFRGIYKHAPSPLIIENGMADSTLMGELTDGVHLKLTARCLVQNLDMTGKVGEVSWAQIMRAVEDEHRFYEWEVHMEGEVGDPAFNPHDRILREVEYLMKEKAASRGLKISGQMFFYADTPVAADR